MSSQIAYSIVWQLAPPVLTKLLLSAVYATFPSFQPGSPHTAVQQRRAALAAVILGLLAWQVNEGLSKAQGPTFYSLLRVDPDISANALKAVFRRLTLQFHPDKVGPGLEQVYVEIKHAFDIVGDETLRFAYDRLGPNLSPQAQAATPKVEYVFAALADSARFYGTQAILLTVMALLGRATQFLGLRIALAFLAASLEMGLLSRSTQQGWSYWVLRVTGLVPFQTIVLLRELYLASTAAVANLLPLLFVNEDQGDSAALASAVEETVALSTALEREAKMTMAITVLPLEGAQEGQKDEISRKLVDAITALELDNVVHEAVMKKAEHGG